MSSLMFSGQFLIELCLLLTAQICLVLLLRNKITSWFGSIVSYKVWLLPLLWTPFYFISALDIDWNFIEFIDGNTNNVFLSSEEIINPTLDYLQINLLPSMLTEFPIQENVGINIKLFFIVFWFSGVVFFLIQQSLIGFRFLKYIKIAAKPISNEEKNEILNPSPFNKNISIMYLQGINGPALFGIVHPVLFLPEDFMLKYDSDQRHIVLSHEAVHLHRKDNIWNLIAGFLKIVFWINPLIHIGYRYFRLDQEVSCDASALNYCNHVQRKRYATTLLESVKQQANLKHPQFLTAWDNLCELKERTHMIKQHIKIKPRPSLALFTFFIVVLTGGSLTSCVSKNMSATEYPNQANIETMQIDNQSLTQSVSDKIIEVMTLRDQENYGGAFAILDELKSMEKNGELNDKEHYTMLLFYASLEQAQGDFESAINTFDEIGLLPTLNLEQQKQMLASKGRLLISLERSKEAITVLNKLAQLNASSGEVDGDIQFLLAAMHFQLEEYSAALPYILRNIESYTANAPRKSYSLLRAIYNLMEDSSNEIAVLEKMVDLFQHPTDVEYLTYMNSGESDGIIPEVNMQLDEGVQLIKAVAPRYPVRALSKGTEGWAQVSFTITEQGQVIDPVVVDADPKGIFDSSSLVAIAKFDFEPKIENGRAVKVEGVEYVFRYDLNE